MGKDVVMAAHHAKGDGDAMSDGDLAGFDLVAHQPHDVCIGADEDEVVGLAGFGQFGALREEAVAGMDGIRTRVEGCVDNLADVEVGVLQGTVAQGIGLVGHAPV